MWNFIFLFMLTALIETVTAIPTHQVNDATPFVGCALLGGYVISILGMMVAAFKWVSPYITLFT